MSLLGRSSLLPAPGRGQYDRSLSRARRQAEQQERLCVAAAEAFALKGSDLAVADIVGLAGTGRNTFYEYFDDVRHALSAVRARVTARLEGAIASALEGVRTPVERLRVISRVYFESLGEVPSQAVVGLARPRATDVLSPVGHVLRDAYLAVMRATRVCGRAEERRALLVAAGAEALFLECVLEPWLEEAQRAEGSEVEAQRAEGSERREGEVRVEAPGVGERARASIGVSAVSGRADERRGEASSREVRQGFKAGVDALVDLAVRMLR